MNVRNLIPFVDEGWDELLANSVFRELCAAAPEFTHLSYDRFAIVDLNEVDIDPEGNTARAAGPQLKKNDLHVGWDPSERPLIIVRINGELKLWDGFNRTEKLTEELGVWSAPAWIYDLDGDLTDAEIFGIKVIVQLSANNKARSDESSKQDFITAGTQWMELNHITALSDVIDWINTCDHYFNSKQVDQIAAQIYCESEVANIKHISTGSKARKEAYKFYDEEYSYNRKGLQNPLVVGCNHPDYIKDVFIQHMEKVIADTDPNCKEDFDLTYTGKGFETTEFVGYTKGCETQEEVVEQRANAKIELEKFEKLILKYASFLMQQRDLEPYEWKGFLPQLYGTEIGKGITKKLIP